MTLSNFDWTDKDSVKWFIILPTGHEGPYSLNAIIQLHEQKRVAKDVKIWSEGLGDAVLLKHAIENAAPEEPPELPPLPIEDETQEGLQDNELVEEPEVSGPEIPPKPRKVWPFLLVIILLMVYFAFSGLMSKYETFKIRRYPKMSLEMHDKIHKDLSFDAWDKKIFFKEYLPTDHTHIWLVTSSFQTCDVEASFKSLDGKLLSTGDETVLFKSRGKLKDHVVELSSFDFSSGSKIIPGMYEVDVKASQCEWDGFIPKLMNKFIGPEPEYTAKTKVILFSKGASEFNKVLDKLIEKKMALELKEKNEIEQFWVVLQQKFETLQAITMQIEQLMLDFIQKDSKQLHQNLPLMVNEYTKKFGSFLTVFVSENEKYFASLILSDSKLAPVKRSYETTVRLMAKTIGQESMKFIEEFQRRKNTLKRKDLQEIDQRVRTSFSKIKNHITQKIIQVSEDRSK